MNRVQVMNFLVTNSVAVPVNIILVPVLLFRAYPSVLGEVICHPTNERNWHSRWWERHVATLRVSGTRMVAVRSDRHHRHPTSRNIWPPKPSYSVNSSRGSNNSNSSGVDPMFINLKLLVTRNSWQLSPSVQQDRRATWCGCLDSHNWVQVFTTSGTMLRAKQGSLCHATASRFGTSLVG